jgi:glycerol-3-phosphate dehydrogenase (NAD(P)+)
MSDRARPRVTVIGAGSWGTALAKHMADCDHEVVLWSRRPDHAHVIQSSRENTQYLPGIQLSPKLRATSDLADALGGAELVISAVPSHTKRQVWTEARAHLPKNAPVVNASKGIENETLALMSDVLHQVLPEHPLAFLAGPSFAKEVAVHHPTAVVLAAHDQALAKELQRDISSDWFRTYVSDDVVGLELGGALKNVIAIACGISDGLGFGHNARAALITRGLAEITRMAMKLGGDPLTLAGLGGLGDLVLTCTGDLSRNRRVGIGLGKGKSLNEILSEMGQVAEGVRTTRSANDLALREGISMPITHEMFQILYEGKPARDSVLDLMRRDLKHEKS